MTVSYDLESISGFVFSPTPRLKKEIVFQVNMNLIKSYPNEGSDLTRYHDQIPW